MSLPDDLCGDCGATVLPGTVCSCNTRQFFNNIVNAGRLGPALAQDPNNPTRLDANMKTKWALLSVLTTGAWLKTHEVVELLDQMQYTRSRSAVRRGLARLVKFGLAHMQPISNAKSRKVWKLTAQGAALAINPAPISKTHLPKRAGGTNQSSKGSPKGNTMCINANKPTLNAAIAAQVNTLLTLGGAFSAYDITKALRVGIEAGTINLDIQETGTIRVHGRDVALVPHDYVRDAVHELYHTGSMPAYGREHTGQYWTYKPLTALVADPTADPATDPAAATPPAAAGGTYDGTPTL